MVYSRDRSLVRVDGHWYGRQWLVDRYRSAAAAIVVPPVTPVVEPVEPEPPLIEPEPTEPLPRRRRIRSAASRALRHCVQWPPPIELVRAVFSILDGELYRDGQPCPSQTVGIADRSIYRAELMHYVETGEWRVNDRSSYNQRQAEASRSSRKMSRQAKTDELLAASPRYEEEEEDYSTFTGQQLAVLLHRSTQWPPPPLRLIRAVILYDHITGGIASNIDFNNLVCDHLAPVARIWQSHCVEVPGIPDQCIRQVAVAQPDEQRYRVYYRGDYIGPANTLSSAIAIYRRSAERDA